MQRWKSYNLKYVFMLQFTRIGAAIVPILPAVEADPTAVALRGVGYSSATCKTTTAKAAEAPNLPAKDKVVTAQSASTKAAP